MKLSSDTQRMIFGFSLLLILAALSAVIALGKVEEKTSFGLAQLEGCFLTLSGGFAQWCFSSRDKPKDPD